MINEYTDIEKDLLDNTCGNLRLTYLGTNIQDLQKAFNELYRQKGQPNGFAELDESGNVPSSQLPSYVDDVLEFATFDDFPTTGESGKIYTSLDTNLTYRWGGTSYVEISKSLALGITENTAYRGDYGKVAYDHSQVTNSNPHGTKTSQLVNDGVFVETIEGMGLSTEDYTTVEKTKLSGISEGAEVNTEIVDNLTTDDSTKVLSAKQGKALNDAISSKINTSEKGVAGGVASLGSDGLVPTNQLPEQKQIDFDIQAIVNQIKEEIGFNDLLNGTGELYEAIEDHVQRKRYKVGSYYIDNDPTPPSTVLGFGTWVQVSEGRHLMATTGTPSDGGSSSLSIAIANLPNHDHSISHIHSLQGGMNGSSNNQLEGLSGGTAWVCKSIGLDYFPGQKYTSEPNKTNSGSTGNGTALPNNPLNHSAYMWYRAA
ncbi:MAG: hypothetical protein LBM02_09415 [Lachnospiraceae bacterium]|jgi:hypothetical protein|nr:hypothetical protein [Lachnospiraceae bacterium]